MKKISKRIATIVAVALFTVLAMACSPRAQSTSPIPESTSEAASPWDGNSPLFYVERFTDGWRGRLIGEIKANQICDVDLAGILIDGKSLDSILDRHELPCDEYGRPTYSTDLTSPVTGQTFQLYDAASGSHAGSGTPMSVQYYYETSSGSDALVCDFDFDEAASDASYYAITGKIQMRPREIVVEAREGGDGRYTIIKADIDNDGVEEVLSWDMSARDGGEDHTITVARESETLCTVNYWYDYDFSRPEEFAYTVPSGPVLLDINGDGVYELVLQAHGHNSYIAIFAWENEEYVRTGAGYYSGD